MPKYDKLCCFFLLLVVIPMMSLGQVNSDAQLLKASFLMKKRSFTAVTDILTKEPISSFNAKYFHQIRGECRYELGDYQGASSDFSWLEQNNYSGIASYYLARIAWINGDRSQAFIYLRKHLTSDDKLPFKEIMRDSVFSGLERDRDWISFWSGDWYTSLDDLLAEANYQLINDFPDASAFNHLMRDFPDNALTWDAQARFYQKTDNKRDAAKAYQNALALGPGDQDILTNYADFLVSENKFKEAIPVYDKILDNNPYLPDVWLKRISAKRNAGYGQQAEQEINRLLTLGIENSDIWLIMVKQYSQSSPQKAIDYLDLLIRDNPLNTEYFNIRADLHQKKGALNAALYDWAMSLDIDPEQADVFFNRANARFDMGDQEGACHDWKKALQYGHRKALDKLYKYCKLPI